MHHRIRFVRSAALFLCALFMVMAATGFAAGPQLINNQGILLDGSGNPITVATSVEFRIYDAAAAGTMLWNETQIVTPDAKGLYNVLLGSVTPIPNSVFNGDAYLTMEISPDAEMPQRQRLVSVPFTYKTRTVDGASGGAISSSVGIGSGHNISGINVFTSGENNTVTGPRAVVAGGVGNTASGDRSAVGGGTSNTASGLWSTIGGGVNNTVTNDNTTVSGGSGNIASGVFATVGGGAGNQAQTDHSTIAGGSSNTASGIWATVGGGLSNTVTNHSSVIAGGQSNSVAGWRAMIPGGFQNTANGDYSLAAGRRAKAMHNGAFVWGDQTDADFASTAVNQFLIRANGGVGIGTNSPAAGAMAVDMTSVHFGGGGGYDFPMTDGAADQVLASDGAGQLGWASLPGIASSQGFGAGFLTVTTTETPMDSVTITIPADGFVSVRCEATFSNNTASTFLDVRLYRDGLSAPGTSGGLLGSWDPGDVDGWYDQHQSYVYTSQITAGTYKYMFSGQMSSGAAGYTSHKITVTYFPAGYGSVASPAPSFSSITTGPALSQNGNLSGDSSVGASGELQAAGDNTVILRELQALRDKVSQLEQRISKNK